VQVRGCFASKVTINDASLKLIASACSYGLLQREALAIWAGCGTLPIVHFPLCEDKHFDLRVAVWSAISEAFLHQSIVQCGMQIYDKHSGAFWSVLNGAKCDSETK
jgi:hypothetical protein